jgi:predicted DNA-binding protein YlxM (UPF0122 family)
MTKAKSKWWSQADIKVIYEYVNKAKEEKTSIWEACEEAAKHFGVTTSAVYQRYNKCEKKLHLKGLKRKTTKVPVVRKSAKTSDEARVEESLVVSTGNMISLDIKDVKLDLKNGKIVIMY